MVVAWHRMVTSLVLVWFQVGATTGTRLLLGWYSGEDDGGDNRDGRFWPEHQSPIQHAQRDNMSHKGNPSL